MTIYLLRHGETLWNREGRLQGHGDSPLTVRGIIQVFACAMILRREIGDPAGVQVQTSPLCRARQTAALVCEVLGLGVEQCIESPLLIEHNFGSWEGLTEQEIETRYPGAQKERHQNHWSYIVPGGESYAQLYDRAKHWLRLPRHARATVVVTHAKMSRVLRGAALDLAPREILRLKHPQDRVYKLHEGRSDELR